MKRLIILLGYFGFFPLSLLAQFENDAQQPYLKYGITVGAGPNLLIGDLEKRMLGGTLFFRGELYWKHGIVFGLELQEGLLRGKDLNGVRSANNFYHTAALDFRFQPFKFLQAPHERRVEYRERYAKRVLNSIYAGVGVGIGFNLLWDMDRPTVSPDSPIVPVYHQGNDHGFSKFLISNLGFEIPLHPLKPYLLSSSIWTIVVNGQLNFALDDDVDGYSGQYDGNRGNDAYALTSIGVKVRF